MVIVINSVQTLILFRQILLIINEPRLRSSAVQRVPPHGGLMACMAVLCCVLFYCVCDNCEGN